MEDEIIKIDLDYELDLHHFHAKDVKDVLIEFIKIAAQNGKKQIRIVHGKGISTIKTIVHDELAKNSKIESFSDDGSNWGATIAVLKDKDALK
ncbi:MAG: Smr/MutS family protein [Spirochaetota bacterium]